MVNAWRPSARIIDLAVSRSWARLASGAIRVRLRVSGAMTAGYPYC